MPWQGGVELEWVVMISSRFSGIRAVQENCSNEAFLS